MHTHYLILVKSEGCWCFVEEEKSKKGKEKKMFLDALCFSKVRLSDNLD